MKIAIIGYGKMGKTIKRLAELQGHEVVYITSSKPKRFELLESKTEVAIEFSTPESAFDNISFLLENNIPTVSGTTGWLDHLQDINEAVVQYNGSFIYASNFSLGVNLYFEIISRTSRLMHDKSEYKCSITETHHTEKKDAPSGTAISIAENIIRESSFKHWALGASIGKDTLPIYAKREANVPGTHQVLYESDLDKIEITHTAFSRDAFANGAIQAAKFIHNKNGIFTMKDVLGL